ncbi:hypothetical protein V2G26_019773 [Clonostachys chloroleuca]
MEIVIYGLRWTRLFSHEVTLSAQVDKHRNPEPVTFVLQHEFVVKWVDGSKDTVSFDLQFGGRSARHTALENSVGISCNITR